MIKTLLSINSLILIASSFEIEKAKVTFNCFDDKCLHLSLELNLNNKSFSVILKQNIYLHRCYYIYKYVNDLTYLAAIDICSFNKVNGWLTYGDSCYQIEYNQTFGNYLITNCGKLFFAFRKFDRYINYNQNKKVVSVSNYRHKRSLIKGFSEEDSNLYLEIVLLFEKSIYIFFDENYEKTLEVARKVINTVDAFYRRLNIIIILTDVIIFNKPKIDFNSANFKIYLEEKIFSKYKTDVIMLITEHIGYQGKFKKLGEAYFKSICEHFSFGRVLFHYDKALLSFILTHELGHVLGYSHIDKQSCNCSSNLCIMFSTVNVKLPELWSNCTVVEKETLYNKGSFRCLYNIPSQSKNKPKCGNGILEKDEECDCISENCKFCCIKEKCILAKHASCGTGICCNFTTCKVIKKDENKLCRNSKSTCDFEERCDGVSEFCPEDRLHQDGSDCGQGFCKNGFCQSQDDQCKLIWGKFAKICPDSFYKHFSYKNQFKFCKVNENGIFGSCKIKDVKCGLLHCYLPLNYNFPIVWHKWVLKFPKPFENCASVWTGKTNFWGYAPNGAKCDHDSICVNRKCIPLNFSMNLTNCHKTCDKSCICKNNQNCNCMNLDYKPSEEQKTKQDEEVNVDNFLKYLILLTVFICILYNVFKLKMEFKQG